MRDPFPIPAPQWLASAVQPWADKLSLPTLPMHIHEIILALIFYQTINLVVAPVLSRRFFAQTYSSFNRRTRINWDVHVVSMVQSLLVNTTALWIIFYDDERNNMNWAGKIWGYDGALGFLQSLAGGYFIWDLFTCTYHIDIFGVGMLAHAISACTVFSLGFRPFLNYYGPVFILYELSSPALNMHWFMDKLNMTGSIYQLINGVVLISTFFFCRLVWGSINSVLVFRDIWIAMQNGGVVGLDENLGLKYGLHQSMPAVTPQNQPSFGSEDIMRFAGSRSLPAWLALSYLASNIVLNVLNWYWFAKMIDALRKRFDPPFGTKRPEKKEKVIEEKTQEPEIEIQRGLYADGRKTFEVTGTSTPPSVRSRRRG
ncbi:hypothetical protein AUEXF2481DRAFT_5408 [Aureobasidium subglaciale EXF-2481]|uniref:TLC domain-containing protein n=1 Tax=Aureobasidium subglaciale (strain EXF-2481) TaxID=1043005 RepID=A0A074YGL2_AURSE|nr:uncharacterized protein AUEXF2481DRAFT_5408 [Aureobasidium subglaciale EXF-2481]KAI5196822.1 DUF887-domain-containing protein [Aureobasidium subglaciale]KAI5215600.1 DUF887-domain-containing protein [Aureobasidium subglaciale]KAI5218853.1 DUF887-domain-containing protein [Aureobasidium subglaciale]KAI5256468.1 DUF887-domain-containing protein [Aureobasidium subglaciale]KEQ95169.1 hypothetical protein AUEXF2481DRAFT_5408 [Aureobasidium subglaciale EXF-2481]